MLIVAAAGASFADQARATFPGEPGSILYSEGAYVKALNPTTGDSRRVVDGGGPYTAEALPSGRSFAYINGNANSIYLRGLANPNLHSPGRLVFRDKKLGLRALSVSRNGGPIVFAAVRGGYGHRRTIDQRIEIYSIGMDGRGLRRLTRNRLFDNDPSISPDGRRIAFVRRSGGPAKIWVMKIDGSEQHQLTHGVGWNRMPSFSPYGKRVVYFAKVPRSGLNGWESEEIFTASSYTGRARVRVTHNRVSDEYPSFSPNGGGVSIIHGNGYSELFIARKDGSHQRQVHVSTDGGGMLWTDWASRPGGH